MMKVILIGWIHCSWSANPRGQALTKDKQGYELWQ